MRYLWALIKGAGYGILLVTLVVWLARKLLL